MWEILVTEAVHEAGLKILSSDPEVNLTQRIGMSREELLEAVRSVHAMITRSGTPLDKEVLAAGKNLKVVARAGVGVDNIDLPEASRRGIIVINAPTGNTLAATEHTFAVLLSVCRKLPQAYQSLLDGRWDRKHFTGTQLSGKTLLVIGLGRIGSRVASRAKAFGMTVHAYDPYIPARRADDLGVSLMPDLAGALALADVVTLHTPMTEETRLMIDEKTLRACKPGAILINCARGRLVDEKACVAALREGRLAGAGFDVFSSEPPEDNPLFAEDLRDRVVLTPHIGANTMEAQSAVSEIAASNLLSALKGEPYEHAVNLPFMEHRLSPPKRLFLSLSRKVGVFAASILDGAPERMALHIKGDLFDDEGILCFENPYRYSAYTVAALKGVLEVHHGPETSYMAAPLLAEERGFRVEEGKGTSSTYHNVIELELAGEKKTIQVTATVTEEGRHRIVNVDGYWLDCVPEGNLIVFQNHDRPGVIGKVGSLLGELNINIANFALGRKNGSGLALGVLQVDSIVDPAVLERLRSVADLLWVESVRLEEGL
ncbi:MAG: D-3-phosphoglycerate dehydrogenase / 2-oxoglutarate reductase [Synergistales bacterium]|jgi:D-3-phosphoglycerate dehydrogenase|nr:D-3-phosphoglycerate dehydrogenase / 2-oxoglutarate reductase [Synergistales bacterium]MDN5336350.1 D-3-phosphoglycerate dehydrogenase / 2-oxoglutarate reductase [Synergistales bacterium]